MVARQLERLGLRLAVHEDFCPAGLHVDGEMRAGQFNVSEREINRLERFQVKILRVHLQAEHGHEVFPA